MVPALGKVGIWSMELRFGDKTQGAAAAAELEALGYGAIWVPGGIGGDVTGDLDHLLDATSKITIATGIINIWKHEPYEIADWFKALPVDRLDRVLLGIGVSHGPLIGEAWAKPLAVTRDYIDKLEAAGLPADHICLAALGPKMTELSGNRTAGSHPYLTTPEHTRQARAILGPEALLAPEQGVILETDPDKARELALGALTHYRRLPNYVNSWKRLGFSDAEIEAPSDRLLHALFAMGTPDDAKARVEEHVAAGASHVCAQVITGGMDTGKALESWRALAAALL